MTKEVVRNYYLIDNKYNAKNETQFKFGERIEKEYGWVCDFRIMAITRGRGWSVSNGSCSSSISIQNFRDANAYYIRLYHPMREYLSKKKYLTACRDGVSIDLEYEINEPKNSFGYEIPNKTRVCK